MLVAFAGIGGTPLNNSAGNEIKLPPPATAFKAPPNMPATNKTIRVCGVKLKVYHESIVSVSRLNIAQCSGIANLSEARPSDPMGVLVKVSICLFLFTFCLLSLVVAQQSNATAAQTTPQVNPCTLPQQKQFDFWVGTWEATWPGAKDGETAHGSNHISRILDSCVVEENFDGGDSMALRGLSVSIFDVRSNKWKQTWVDNQGAYLDFVGEFKDGQMTLGRDALKPNGTRVQQRMVYKNITPDAFDWSWESSTDGGKTWQVQWPIHYRRRS